MSWNLSTIFASYKCFEEQQQKIAKTLSSFKFSNHLKSSIFSFQEIGKDLKEAESYVTCLCAQNTSDPVAYQYQSDLSKLKASYLNLGLTLGEKLKNLDDAGFKALLIDPELKGISFHLNELRENSKKKLDFEREKLINELSSFGYHGLWDLYCSLVGKIRLSVNGKSLSVGQAENLMGHEDRNVRQEVFKIWTEAWKKESDILAQILNHLAGFRLKVYEERGWDELLQEPLDACRMQKKTLMVMWEVIQKNKPIFLKYLKKKAELLGVEKLSWSDLNAPIKMEKPRNISYHQASSLIFRHFDRYSSRLAQFAKMTFDKQWIESENRAGKAAGGFCTPFPKSKESRIFMTFGSSMYCLATLAHEIGHAYHFHRLSALPFYQQNCGMNVAETASTFAEMVVIDGALKEAEDREEKLFLLDDKLQRAIRFFMNIHARYLFEFSFYEERKKGFVSADRLCQLMEDAQKSAYLDSLGEYFPYFWASKLHFYYTEIPFYNFPYTFGFLFSFGLYAQGEKEGKSFMDKYDSILDDTARMTVEELASKHLKIDLGKPEFWQQAIDLLAKDVKEFISL